MPSLTLDYRKLKAAIVADVKAALNVTRVYWGPAPEPRAEDRQPFAVVVMGSVSQQFETVSECVREWTFDVTLVRTALPPGQDETDFAVDTFDDLAFQFEAGPVYAEVGMLPLMSAGPVLSYPDAGAFAVTATFTCRSMHPHESRGGGRTEPRLTETGVG